MERGKTRVGAPPTLTHPFPPPHSPATLASLRSWADAARASGTLPAIYLPLRPVPDAGAAPAWADVASARAAPAPLGPDGRPAAWAAVKHAPVRSKPGAPGGVAAPGGRTYTSRYRGVHQTLPTRRWEAQFRRGGRPTSLGCFDTEEAAARAYDRMMLWCELHGAAGAKGGVTNFDPAEYAADVASLRASSQDDLVLALRAEGRRQAAERSKAAKAAGVKRPRRKKTAEAEVKQEGGGGDAANARAAAPEASTGGSEGGG